MIDNSYLIDSLFEKVVQDFLAEYQHDNDPNYILKCNLDDEFFIRNCCPDWAEELDLLDFRTERYICKGDLNDVFNRACFEFFKDELRRLGILCD